MSSVTDLPSYEQFVYALLAIKYVMESQTYKQAIASGEAAQWGKAMDSEIQSHEDNETWVLVPRPKGRNVLKNGWVYVIKYKSDRSVGRVKARLVIIGFLQKNGIDYTEIFAPVVCMEILRLLLAVAAAMDWEVEQVDYATKVFDRFGLAQFRPVRSPEETSQKLSESDCPTTDAEKQEMEKLTYREAVGSFMYLMMGTRPDLANFVRQVSRYLYNPGPHHWNYVVRGLKYLKRIRDYSITLGARDVTNATLAHALSAYSDADYANNVDTRRSVSGYVQYVALASTVQEVLYLKQVMLELGYDQVHPVRIGEDN
ncbi:unnamed protein product [Phytophthora fragariaefolia]|uniref:Unnamed protein product n=1 Tax=Phytophthora fragariaefolia TaxID=1490495 RepID=A0A9W7CSH1_9STRA|nr:unnamed protein product [Phytophthora fragariaefolia]